MLSLQVDEILFLTACLFGEGAFACKLGDTTTCWHADFLPTSVAVM